MKKNIIKCVCLVQTSGVVHKQAFEPLLVRWRTLAGEFRAGYIETLKVFICIDMKINQLHRFLKHGNVVQH